jgi:hypothetical protein
MASNVAIGEIDPRGDGKALSLTPPLKPISERFGMAFVEAIECTREAEKKRAIYFSAILLLLALELVPTAAQLWGAGTSGVSDFQGFYLAAQMVWRGTVEQAYHVATLSQLQRSADGGWVFQPWTYPPLFDLLIAPFALLPQGLAYCVFMVGTFAAYAATMRRIANENLVPVLILLLPIMIITIRCGQNGFLTGTLIGLTCLGLLSGRSIAGLPLGLMIIKPHLAAAFAVYVLVTRRWGTALVAAATVLATSALATVLLGPTIWTAFLDGAKEARVSLDQGFYPLFRMTSVYAAVRSFGFSVFVANAAQVLTSIMAIGSVIISARQFPPRRALGITAIATLLVSPYEYDYDLMVLGIGLSLLLPDLIKFGTRGERFVIYASSLFIGIFNIAQSTISTASDTDKRLGEYVQPLSLSGLVLVVIFFVTWRILLSSDARHAGDARIPISEPAYVRVNASLPTP